MSIPGSNPGRSAGYPPCRRWRVLTQALLLPFLLGALLFSGLQTLSAQSAHTVTVTVVERSFLFVTVNGSQSYYGVLEAGSEHSWTGESIYLFTGNADGVQVTADGIFLGPLGGPGQSATLSWPADAERFAAAAEGNRAAEATGTTGEQEPSNEETAPPESAEGGEAEAAETEVQAVVHVVQPGDTLGAIAEQYGVEIESLQLANSLENPDALSIGWVLIIPNADGSIPEGALEAVSAVSTSTVAAPGIIAARGTITERMTIHARAMESSSPFFEKTWVTYYGRPNVPIMGILGEYDVDELAVRLRQQAAAYDEANGPALSVQPAFHLVYGMATRAPGDGSYLGYMLDEEVMTYITKAQELGYGVILDVQIGALTPAEAIVPALSYLVYDNVHLAIDPEFAMVHPGQAVPGDPIGFVTADQVNETQAVIQQYMEENGLEGPRILLVHQFQDSMIVDKDQFDPTYELVALTLSVDGWGGPWGKISKYNGMVDETSPYVAFKLFYRWDEPLLGEGHALGEEAYPELGYMEITPNLIIYQ